VLAEFIDCGFYGAHLRNARELQKDRRSLLIRLLKERMRQGFRVREDCNGLHLLVDLPVQMDAGALAGRLRSKGVMCMALTDFADVACPPPTLILGFAAFDAPVLEEATARLAAELNSA
jgi:DNA-binding transcriptional MocR family regulator